MKYDAGREVAVGWVDQVDAAGEDTLNLLHVVLVPSGGFLSFRLYFLLFHFLSKATGVVKVMRIPLAVLRFPQCVHLG